MVTLAIVVATSVVVGLALLSYAALVTGARADRLSARLATAAGAPAEKSEGDRARAESGAADRASEDLNIHTHFI